MKDLNAQTTSFSRNSCNTMRRNGQESTAKRRQRPHTTSHRAVLVAILCTTWYYCLVGDAFYVPARSTTRLVPVEHHEATLPLQRTRSFLYATTRQNSGAASNSNSSGGKQSPGRRRTRSRLKASSSSSSASSSVPTVKNGVKQKRTSKKSDIKVQQRKKSTTTKRTPPASRYELLDHEILSKKEEQRLGRQLQRALQVQAKMDSLIEQKELQRLERYQTESLEDEQEDDDDLLSMEEQLEDFLMRTQRSSDSRQTQSGHYIRDYDMFNEYDSNRIRLDDGDEDLLGLSVYGMDGPNPMQELDARSVVTRGVNSFAITDVSLSDEEIQEKLGIDGGRKELSRILVEGALAKEQMIKSNIRLVMSIAKKWLMSNNSGDGDTTNVYMLSGSWTRPSLDEVVQEGILGLAKAAERFDPERNLKFSTYATFYITNEVRLSFQRASTGCLRVPQNYYLIRKRYEKIVKDHYLKTGKPLDMAVAAEKLGLSWDRLDYILRMTLPLLQLDGPMPMGLANSAGKAGANSGSYGAPPSFADYLECMEPTPEAIVERSLLRQCLENALANELSPHERDIIRLRHGLDDGVSRTVKEVVEFCGGMMSQSDVRRAEFRAYSKLRTPHSLHNRRLLGFAAEFASYDPSESI